MTESQLKLEDCPSPFRILANLPGLEAVNS